jgi:isoprenylcysteine carboxyl methyltransferase (ICMT) family protein YpbQ
VLRKQHFQGRHDFMAALFLFSVTIEAWFHDANSCAANFPLLRRLLLTALALRSLILAIASPLRKTWCVAVAVIRVVKQQSALRRALTAQPAQSS